MGLPFFFSAHRLIVVYISTKVHEKYSRRYQSYRANTVFIRKFSKGHNSLKNVGGVTVLVLCTSSDDGLYFYNVS